MTDLVDQMFPPIHRKWAAEFTDVNFWRPPMAEFDFPELTAPSPPSPALSARSDASMQSGLSRLRNFSLRTQPQQFVPPSTANSARHNNGAANHRDGRGGQVQRPDHQRAKSSFGSSAMHESGVNGLGHARHTSAGEVGARGISVPRGVGVGASTEGNGGSFGKERRVGHRVGSGSMPGSYEEFRLDDGEDEEEGEGGEEGESDEEGEEEEEEGEYSDEEEEEENVDELEHEEFDDELLATGAMDDIPFL